MRDGSTVTCLRAAATTSATSSTTTWTAPISSKFASYVTVLENGREVRKQEIAVNSPLRQAGYRFYQSSYDPDNPRVSGTYESVTLAVVDSAGSNARHADAAARRGNRGAGRHA